MPLYTHYVNGISLGIFEKICHYSFFDVVGDKALPTFLILAAVATWWFVRHQAIRMQVYVVVMTVAFLLATIVVVQYHLI